MAKTTQLDENGYRKFGTLDKLSYAAGDFGCNCSFALAGTWFTAFWTQYMKIDALFFAGLLIAFKVWDAINDTLIGAIMDSSKKEYKRGKFLSYIVFGSFLLTVSACICFIPVPNAPMITKCLICAVGYVMWDAAYTIVNVPYGAMLSVVTAVPGERAQLGAWRSLGAMAASIPMAVLLPMFLYDADKNIRGEILFPVAAVLGVVGLAAFWFMIKTTVIRVKTDVKVSEQKFNLLEALGNFMKNRAAVGATMIPVGMFLGQYGAAVCTQVVFQTYFNNPGMSGLMQLVTMLPALLFIPFSKKLTEKYGKKEAASFGLVFSVAACILMNIVPMPQGMVGILIYISLALVNGLGMGVSLCLQAAMMADAIDYNEWKNGTREEGVIYAVHSFFRKLAQGIGPSIGLVLMVAVGYDEQLGAAQMAGVPERLRYLMTAMALVSSVICFISVKYIYNLDKNTLSQMNKELGR